LATLIAVPTYDHGWIQVGLSRHANEAQLKYIRDNFGWAMVIIILAAIISGWWQVSRALAGVEHRQQICLISLAVFIDPTVAGARSAMV